MWSIWGFVVAWSRTSPTLSWHTAHTSLWPSRKRKEPLLICPCCAPSVLPPVNYTFYRRSRGEAQKVGGERVTTARPGILFMQNVISVTVAYVVGLTGCVLQEHTHLLACGLPSLQQHSTTTTPCISPAKLHHSLPAALPLSPAPLLTSLL